MLNQDPPHFSALQGMLQYVAATSYSHTDFGSLWKQSCVLLLARMDIFTHTHAYPRTRAWLRAHEQSPSNLQQQILCVVHREAEKINLRNKVYKNLKDAAYT